MKIQVNLGDSSRSTCVDGTRRLLALCLLALILEIPAMDAIASSVLDNLISVDIPENTRLEDALIDWGSKAQVTVMFNTATVGAQTTRGVHGTLPAGQALSILLQGSGLSFTQEDGRIRVLPESRPAHSAVEKLPMVTMSPTKLDIDSGVTRLGAEISDGDIAIASESERSNLPEVVVTAQKREERLQDVPVPVTAVSANTLVEANQLQLTDYYTSVPGLSLNTQGTGDTQLVIRGLTTGANTNSTVAVLIDDVPVSGSSVITANNAYVPDLDPSNLARIEVLRGPQGTLYGAATLGGLLKYVTVDPSTQAVSTRLEVSGTGIQNGDGLGYGVRGAVNLPISSTIALQASGFTRKDPGYVNNPILDIRGINEDHVSGGRVAAMWRPSDTLSVKVSALIQENSGEGPSTVSVQPGLGDLQQNLLAGTGAWSVHEQIYTAAIRAMLGGVDFTSVSGYNSTHNALIGDLSLAFGPGTAVTNDAKNHKFSQEFRFSSKLRERLEWMVGLFYTHERAPVDQGLEHLNPLSGAFIRSLADLNFPTTFTEYAGYADFTIHFTDRFDLQLGGRESGNKQTYQETDRGPFVPFLDPGYSSPAVLPSIDSRDHSFTYLVTPRFRFTPDLMAYARFSSGYRPGGPNSSAVIFNAPAEFKPDETKNYEAGVKGEALHHKVSFDGSFYYINWTDLQTSVISPTGTSYITNGGNAKSQGVELSGNASPLEGTTIGGWVAWNDAKLTSDFVTGSQLAGVSGDRLPFSARYSAELSVGQEFAFRSKGAFYVRGSGTYLGDRLGSFVGAGPGANPRISIPSYIQANIAAGIRYGSWAIHFVANNIADRRGIVSGGYLGSNGAQYVYIRPRTVSLSLVYSTE